MKGWIFGGPHQRFWTQKIYRSNHKFQNPLPQNYKHVKTLQTLLGLGDHQMQTPRGLVSLLRKAVVNGSLLISAVMQAGVGRFLIAR